MSRCSAARVRHETQGDHQWLSGSRRDGGSEEPPIPFTKKVKSRIEDAVRHAAYLIIEGKGATYHGIGAGIARIVQTIRDDEGRVLTLSSFTQDIGAFKGISLSLPRLLGGKGVLAELRPNISGDEQTALEKSAAILHDATSRLGY